MRKIFTALLATLAFAAVAQPALADNPSSSHWKSYEWAFGSEHTNCQSPYSFGVYKYGGAWGWFVDGCTTRAAICKLAKCWYQSRTEITMLDGALWWPRTQNSRTRVFSPSGSQLSYVDQSCEANGQFVRRCGTGTSGNVTRGQMVTVQCNGVRGGDGYAYASNKCTVTMQTS